MDETKSLFTLDQVAERFQVSNETARRMVKAGALPAYRVGHQIRVSESAINAYLRSRMVAATA